jgi:hypothetical protein
MAACGEFSAGDAVPQDGGPEAAAPPPDGSSEGGAPRGTKIVFVTKGRVMSGGGPVDTRARANQLCVDEAGPAGIGSSYVAWLSTDDLDAIDALSASDGPWSLAKDGGVVFANRAAIFQLRLDRAIDRYADGTTFPPGFRVWTGTMGNGRKGLHNCSDWNSNALNGQCIAGDPAAGTGLEWTEANTINCDTPRGVICFGL